MKAVVLDGFTLNPGDLSWNKLECIVELTVYDRTEEKDILKRINDCEIVITNKTPITKEIIEKAPNIKYIGVLATGYNIVDIDAAKKKRIPVTNVPSYSTNSVSQLVFAFILEICHNVGAHTLDVKKGQWVKSQDFCFWNHTLIELADKTLGVIGFGSIGQKVAQIAISFGMNVIVYNRTIKKAFENEKLCFVELEELYKKADIITIHVPLTEDTKNMINKNSINLMKDGVILVNTSRGGVIVEEDLYQALETEKIYASGVDVSQNEPIKDNSPLLKAKNIFITPHIAWATKEARIRLMDIAIDNLKAFLSHKYQNVVNELY